MKEIKGDLILKENYSIDDNLIVHGNIICEGGFWNIDAWKIDARDINAGNIDAGDIDAGDIKAWNIDAGDIKAWNIKARDINTWDIKAWDIKARNIKALDIDAWDIEYYAVAFAYNSFKCKSIKGSRKNSKHFCLDGEIKIWKV
jgi:hypothetical protein